MRFTRLQEWLSWQETCHPKEMDFGLGRVSRVAERLGVLKAAQQATVVTIGGTNGKGSCAHTLECLLSLTGARFGTYSSPHVMRYNERIRIDGLEAEDDAICNAFSAIDLARGEISLTYFEFATLAALWMFAEQKLDYWLLEVGLGGRLDATNIVDADFSVVTSIDLDHTEWLGDTREAIAAEKAGIFRPGKPVICLDPYPPDTLLRSAERLGCPVLQLPRECCLTESEAFLCITDKEFDLRCVDLPKRSVAGALLIFNCLGLLQRQDVGAVQRVLAGLKLSGRLQQTQVNGRLVLLDVAHNPAAIRYLVERLRARYPGECQQGFHVIIGMMRDKDITNCLKLLEPISRGWRFCPVSGGLRACSVDELVSLATFSKVTHVRYDSVAQALHKETCDVHSNPLLVVGSFLTVAEALHWLREEAVNSYETA